MPLATKKPVSRKTSASTRKLSLQNLKINLKTGITVAIIVGLCGYGILNNPFSSAPTGEAAYEQIVLPGDDSQALTGLKKVKTDADNPCAGVYEVAGKVDAEGDKLCTGSNEALPVNPLTPAKTSQLQSEVKAMEQNNAQETIDTIKATGKPETNQTIAKEYQAVTSAAGSVSYQGASPLTPTAPSCYGTGKDGQRIVLVAAGTKEKPVTPAEIALIQNVAGQMESTLIWNSYKQNPNNVMHWRFFQSADCKPIVITTTQAADYYNELSVFTYSALKQDSGILAAANSAKEQASGQGMLPHFLVFTRSGGNACGQSDFNLGGSSNKQETFSFVYGATPSAGSGTQCWNGAVAQHEFLHSIGAVDFSAPHTTFFGHCSDEYDIMCYNDTNGAIPMRTVCPESGIDGWLADYVMDCGADDYFSVKANADSVFNPAPWWLGGSGLARYNTAKSGFMTNLATSTTTITPVTPVPAPNVPPEVKIISPVTGTTLAAGAALKVDATASDKDGITKVTFYNGTTELGTDTTQPYSIELKSLPSTKVSIKAKAEDKTGSTTTSSEVVVNLASPAQVDTSKPVGPATVNVGISFDIFQGGNGMNISWPAATDNVKVTQYRVYRNDTEIAKVTGTSFRDRAITNGGTYTYQVFAEDAATNRSAGSTKQTRKVSCFLLFCSV